MVDFGKPTEAVDSVSVVPNFRTARELSNSFPALRTPVIEGLLRNGETLNIIAPPKTGKSWLVLDAALSIATGRPWMGCNTTPGKVLILDNELHGETMASRLPWVADARNIHFDEYADRLCVDSLRGRLTPLSQMNHYFARIESKEFQVIVLDAWYRFLEPGADENDNGSTTQMYNWLDRFAHNLGCCFVCIHHSMIQ